MQSYTPTDIVQALPVFTVGSAGYVDAIAALTLQGAQQSFEFLQQLTLQMGHTPLVPVPVTSFGDSDEARRAADELLRLFDQHRSDKGSIHQYHHVYGHVLSRPEAVHAVFEIGLGTNHEDVVSTMGRHGQPGASLRAFRDFLPHAAIHGADVDRRILFEEERIRTHFIDQTDLDSIGALSAQLDIEFDLIIDDGLHAPNANIAALLFGLPKLRRGGTMVVEDILPVHFPVWQVIAALLPRQVYACSLAVANGGCLFVAQRKV